MLHMTQHINKPYRILSLDGGGAKGFYTLGVLREIEGMLGCPLHQVFDLIFGTSTGAIIASQLALGSSVSDIHDLYKTHVVKIMKRKTAHQKSAALNDLAKEIYGDWSFTDVKTGIGIVTTKWMLERPMIFKGDVGQAHGRIGTFVPGFGVSIADAVIASCSAYPFFEKKSVITSSGDKIELVDGGYCANNPTLYSIADALVALKIQPENLRVLSVGVGTYPEPSAKIFTKGWFAQYLQSVQLLQKTLEINTQSLDQLRAVLYKHISTLRVSDSFAQPEMATNLFEHNLDKLNMLTQRGVESFSIKENEISQLLLR